MEQLTIQQLFGVNATQDSQTLTISKSDLPLLTALVANTVESLLVAILLKALSNFQGYVENENAIPITDENYNPIKFDNKEAYELLSLFRWDSFFSKRDSSFFVTNTIIIDSFVLYED
jgi:hypothetical protein